MAKVRVSKEKCRGSGWQFPQGTVDPLALAACPECGRVLKSRWADGGFSAHCGLYTADYAYLPTHNKPLSKEGK